MKRLVLIDGHAILHRAYYAFPKNLRTRKGEVVNAVYGFTRMLLRVIEDLRPEYLVVAWDLPQPTFRHQEFIGYQANRPQKDAELKEQFSRVRQVVKTLGFPLAAKQGYEADDIIGTLAKQAVRQQVKTVIVTGDRDIFQLVEKNVRVYAPQRGFTNPIFFNRQKVKASLGVYPKQIVDYKALVGDSSDNYPGVPGIGPKTAVRLLAEYSNLDTIYNRLSKIKPALAKKLKEGQKSAVLSKKLAKIVTNVPIKLNLRACRVTDYDREEVFKLFEELEFKSLIRLLPGAESNQEKNRQMPLL